MDMKYEAEQLQLIIENTPDLAIFLIDTTQCLTQWNIGAERLLGWKEAEIIGQAFEVFFTPEDRMAGVPTQEMLRARNEGRAKNERWHVRKDGSCFWGSSFVQPLYENGDLCGYMEILRDHTAYEQAEGALRASEMQFSGLADNIAQLAWIADGTGWIFWYNRRWYDYTGTTPAQMEGWGWQSVHHPVTLPHVMERWKASIATGESFDMEFPLKGADGIFRPFLTRVCPIKDEHGNVTRWCGTNTDVTEQREIEEVLRQHQSEIEGLNARLARAMQETHHRVKNNLQVISALLEIEETSGSEAQLGRIKQHTQALAMIHDILTAQTKNDALDASYVSAQTVLGRLTRMLDQSSGRRRIRAEVEELLLPVQKSASLALLVNECVSNAIKHGAANITITLELFDHQSSDLEQGAERQARLEVCDDGPGFPPDFDPGKAANTGLELIESAAQWDLRGTVQYQNRAEGGARVVVTFPVAQDD